MIYYLKEIFRSADQAKSRAPRKDLQGKFMSMNLGKKPSNQKALDFDS
jgi:hypothetical protein